MKSLLLCLCSALLTINSAKPQVFEPKSGPLSVLNNTFHKDYNSLVKKTTDGFGDNSHPVFVFTGDTLIMLHQKQRSVSRIIPSAYHQLKSFDHLPLGIFTLLINWPEGKLSAEQRIGLNKHIESLQNAKDELRNFAFSDKVADNQLKILNYSKAFLQSVLEKNEIKRTEINEFAKFISPFMLINADEAARLEITNLHNQVKTWCKNMDTTSFNNLYVVIGSSHQARYRELTVQYFDKLLNEQSSSTALTENRVVFAESVFEEKGCLSLLARHIIDQEIGLQFFGDKFRMQRDLLSDAATKYIDPLFPVIKK